MPDQFLKQEGLCTKPLAKVVISKSMLLPSLDDRGRSRFSFRSFQHKVKYLMVITYHSGTGLYQHHFPLMNSIIIILMREVIKKKIYYLNVEIVTPIKENLIKNP